MPNLNRKMECLMQIGKSLKILNGFIHDFSAGIWLAAIVTISWLHSAHIAEPSTTPIINIIERRLFWSSVVAALLIIITGAGRTFTYVDNWYGEDAEAKRRKALVLKHIILFAAYAAGYLWIWKKVFH